MNKNDRWQEMVRKEKEAMELWGTVMAIGVTLIAGAAAAWGWLG